MIGQGIGELPALRCLGAFSTVKSTNANGTMNGE